MTRGTGNGRTPERVVKLLQEKVNQSSQTAVSGVLGIGIPTVHRYLKGIGEPSHDIMQKLSIYFERPVEWLRGEDVQDFWGQVYGDNLTEEEIEELKLAFWSNRVERAIHSPILIEVVKCLTKVPSGARTAAFAIIRNSCRYIESLSEEELVKVGNDLLKRVQETCQCPPESKPAE